MDRLHFTPRTSILARSTKWVDHKLVPLHIGGLLRLLHDLSGLLLGSVRIRIVWVHGHLDAKRSLAFVLLAGETFEST